MSCFAAPCTPPSWPRRAALPAPRHRVRKRQPLRSQRRWGSATISAQQKPDVAISCRFGSFELPQHLETLADTRRIKGGREHAMISDPRVHQKYRRGVIDGIVFQTGGDGNLIGGADLTRQVTALSVV